METIIKYKITNERLKFKQHKYVKGRSVEIVLYKVVHGLEESFKQKTYTLTMCIEIKDALNNVRTHTIQSLDNFQVDLTRYFRGRYFNTTPVLYHYKQSIKDPNQRRT